MEATASTAKTLIPEKEKVFKKIKETLTQTEVGKKKIVLCATESGLTWIQKHNENEVEAGRYVFSFLHNNNPVYRYIGHASQLVLPVF